MPPAAPSKEQEARAFALEKYRLDRQHELELNKATAAFEQETLKMLTYLNGGSAFIYATFAGTLVKDRPGNFDADLLLPVIVWSAGLLSAALSLWLMYEAQVRFTQAYHKRRRAEEKRRFEGFPEYAKVTDSETGMETYEAQATSCQQQGSWIKNCAKLAGLASVLCFVAGILMSISPITRIG